MLWVLSHRVTDLAETPKECGGLETSQKLLKGEASYATGTLNIHKRMRGGKVWDTMLARMLSGRREEQWEKVEPSTYVPYVRAPYSEPLSLLPRPYFTLAGLQHHCLGRQAFPAVHAGRSLAIGRLR